MNDPGLGGLGCLFSTKNTQSFFYAFICIFKWHNMYIFSTFVTLKIGVLLLVINPNIKPAENQSIYTLGAQNSQVAFLHRGRC